MADEDTAQREAWLEYLEACRLAADHYEVVEVWAWDRLRARLRETALPLPVVKD